MLLKARLSYIGRSKKTGSAKTRIRTKQIETNRRQNIRKKKTVLLSFVFFLSFSFVFFLLINDFKLKSFIVSKKRTEYQVSFLWVYACMYVYIFYFFLFFFFLPFLSHAIFFFKSFFLIVIIDLSIVVTHFLDN